MDDKLWLFNLVGKEKIDRLLDVFEYARRRYGVDTFIIDSFMRLGIGVDDYKAQDNAIFQLTDWVVQRPVHLHLVAHARKSENSGVPDTEAVKGTSEIGANAFNVLGVWRNRKLEDQLSQARLQNDEEEIRHLEAIPPVSINVAKNRNGDFEGKRGLHFDLRNYRYYSGQRDSRQYVPTVQPFDIDRVG
jgi:twinkle protein